MIKWDPSAYVKSVRPFIGIGLVIITGFGFAISVLIISMAVKSGVDVSTSNAIRYLTAAITIYIYHKVTNRPINIPTRERFAALSLGITVFMMGVGYIGATKHIPVSLAVLIFYTGPIFVVFISRFTEKEPLTIIRLTAIGTGFLGLYLVLEIQNMGIFHFKGIFFAFIASIGMAFFITGSSLTIRTADLQVVNLYALSSSTILFAIFLFLTSGTMNALNQVNLLKLFASGFIVGVSHITFYVGLKIIGPVMASMLLNTEPIFTIGLSAMILGEHLSFVQSIGAALIVIGIMLVNYKPYKKNPLAQKKQRILLNRRW